MSEKNCAWELIAYVKNPNTVKPARKDVVLMRIEGEWALFLPNPKGEWRIKYEGESAYAVKYSCNESSG